jgi:hypothetical protein
LQHTYTLDSVEDVVGCIGTGGGLVVPVVEGGEGREVALHIGSGEGGEDGFHLRLVRGRGKGGSGCELAIGGETNAVLLLLLVDFCDIELLGEEWGLIVKARSVKR